jgi:hypothetical protein
VCDFFLQLTCEAFFFSPGWIQSPHIIAQKIPSSKDPFNPLLAGIALPAAQCSVTWEGSCNVKMSYNIPWQIRYRTPVQFYLRATKLKYRQTCTYHCTYIDALFLCMDQIACCLRADQMLPTMLALRKKLNGHDEAATFCSIFAAVYSESGRFALHIHTRCCAQSFIWEVELPRSYATYRMSSRCKLQRVSCSAYLVSNDTYKGVFAHPRLVLFAANNSLTTCRKVVPENM